MQKIKDLVENSKFQNSILAVIILNAAIMGVQTSKTIMASPAGQVLTVIDNICLVIFIIELLLKMIAYNKNFFKDGWNIFDFIIILVSVAPNLSFFSVMRVLRALRVLRSLKTLKTLKTLRTLKLVSGLGHLRIILQAIINSIPGIAWTSLFLMIIYYIYAIVGVTLFGDVFDEWFGTLGRSFYSLFQVMTLESWSMGISRPVMEVYPSAWIYFVSFVLMSSFIVMNVVVGIVVNAISEVTELDKKDNIKEEAKDLKIEFEKLKEQLKVVEALLDEAANTEAGNTEADTKTEAAATKTE